MPKRHTGRTLIGLTAIALFLSPLCLLLANAPHSHAAPSAVPAPSLRALEAAAPDTGAPESLAVWKDWVLGGEPEAACPTVGNDPGTRQCAFPTRLSLALDDSGATFVMTVTVFAETGVALPRTARAWPDEVRANGRPLPVAWAGSGTPPTPKGQPGTPPTGTAEPRVVLPAGEHEISGRLTFSGMPEVISIDARTGLVEMTRNGAAVPFELGPGGQMRTAVARTEKKDGDALSVTVFRLVRDGSPLTVTTLARLDVSGMARRLTLERLLPAGSVPLGAKSPLPVAFGPDGTLFVQAGPGRFEVEVTSRMPGRVTAIGPAPCPFGPETWAFSPAPDLREVELAGASAVDPRNTDLPGAWKGFAALAVTPGTVLTLTETHRGEPPAGPDAVSLTRTLWLDFSGRGATVQDRLTGEVRHARTLTMPLPGALGRVTLAGRDAPVVLVRPEGASADAAPTPGVVLPGSRLDAVAESRLDDFSGVFPAVGFDLDVARLSAEVRLPPGWTVLAAGGADAASPTFVGQFTLLDLFLILLAALAAAKLGGLAAGGCVFVFAALSLHETDAPGTAWIFLLAALALARLAAAKGVAERAPWFGRLTRILRGGAWLVMLVATVQFIPAQLRQGMHPQLEDRGQFFAPQVDLAPAMAPETSRNMAQGDMEYLDEDAPPAPPPGPAGKVSRAAKAAPMAMAAGAAPPGERASLDYDPEALIQTGPGLPDWSFHTLNLSFDGPVSRTQSVRLWLIPPFANLILAFVRSALLLAALFLLARRDRMLLPDGPAPAPAAAAGTASAVALALAALLAAATPVAAQDFPPRELLEAYKARLTKPAACFPACLGSPRAEITARDGRLTIMLRLDAAARTTAPLPRVSDGWRPDSVSLDDAPARELARRGDEAHLLLPRGVHRVVLSGPLPTADSFAVDWPLPPRFLAVTAPGFQTRGLSADGIPERVVRLDREKKDAPPAAGSDTPPSEAATSRFAPFLHVSRTITMGLTWGVVTDVTRVSPPGEAVAAEIALLPGEAVLDETVKAVGGKALVTLQPDQQRLSFTSKLAVAPELALVAQTDAPFTETWTLAPSPIWEVTPSGVPPSRTFDPAGIFQPVYRPWPGETLTVGVARPGPAPGETLTIDSAHLRVSRGERLAESSLSLTLRAARGMRHVLTLPADAAQIKLVVDGRETAYGGDPAAGDAGQAPGRVEFPIKPGAHDVQVTWRQDAGMSLVAHGPAVDLGHAAVNVLVEIELPRDRWTLLVFGDTPLSPVVGFWSYLAFILAAALILGGFQATPLSRTQWFLLALGLSQIPAPAAMLAAAWLFALGLRRSYAPRDGWLAFNAMQTGLAALTAVGLFCLYTAIERGLLGDPLMQVAGNGSSARLLRFTFDRVAGMVPDTMVVSAPLVFYRLAMLAWSLWMALALLSWLKWGVARFTEDGAWRRSVIRLPRFSRQAGPVSPPSPPEGGQGPDAPGSANP
ncbi:MAG: hypothetical protein RDU30_12270 [Desulfovibrionaceae bacterium]|nr:hypothetical protein [Desulfovibrionaceae bacterium]